MKKTAIKIAIISISYVFAVFVINSLFIRPGIIRVYGFSPSEKIFQQAFLGVFIPVFLFLPAFFTMFWKQERLKLTNILFTGSLFTVLTFIILMLFVVPGFSIGSVLLFMLILVGFTFFTYSLAYFLINIKIPYYWRSLIVVVIVFALITNVLWMNPIFEANTSDTATLTKLVNFNITLNPAIVSVEKVFNMNIFRSGNFYSHSGGVGLSLIGDYFNGIDYYDPGIIYPLIYSILGLIFLMPSLIIRKFRK